MRKLVWFSCGAASAVAAYMALRKYPDAEIVYCDTLKYEHPDNVRFLSDIESWIGKPIKILKSDRYKDIMECFRATKFVVGPRFAPCTKYLKKDVRIKYSTPHDIHIFGYTVEEKHRVERFERQNQQLWCEWILLDEGITKQDCFKILQSAGIILPKMYLLGYGNNNCIGCVKGGKGYWNRIRVDFPDRYHEMASLERELGARIHRDVFLDELPPDAGRFKPIYVGECGVLCTGER